MIKIVKIIISSAILSAFIATPVYANTYAQFLCKNSDYQCVKIKRGQTWHSIFPDSEQRNLVMRLNRMNVQLQSGMTIAIPKDLAYLDLEDISPFDKNIETINQKVIVFDPRKLAWAAYDEDGDLVRWGPAAGGAGWCSDVGRSCRTIRGEFTMYHKRGEWCKSSKFPVGYGGAPMPHCMFFYRGFAMHGSPIVPGYNASHGCIRLFNEDAKWLNEEFIDLKNTKVIIKPYGGYNSET